MRVCGEGGKRDGDVGMEWEGEQDGTGTVCQIHTCIWIDLYREGE